MVYNQRGRWRGPAPPADCKPVEDALTGVPFGSTPNPASRRKASVTPAAKPVAPAKPEKAEAPATKADPEPKSGGDDGDAT